MNRIILASFGGLLVAIAMWAMVGFSSALFLSRLPGWQREGEGAMTGVFFIGPIAGFFGLLAGTWWLWRLTADPARQGQIAIGLAALAGLMVLAGVVTMMPKPLVADQTPGRLLLEVKMPASLAARSNIVFEMRAGGQFEETPADLAAARRDAEAIVVPASFRLGRKSGNWVFAVMNGDQQVAVISLELPYQPAQSLAWTPFREMAPGVEMRWSIAIER